MTLVLLYILTTHSHSRHVDWSAKELFEDFSFVKDYLGIVIPIGISATATTLMCLVSAKNAGDPFPVRGKRHFICQSLSNEYAAHFLLTPLVFV